MLGVNYALLATTAVFRSQQNVEERSDALSCYIIIYIYTERDAVRSPFSHVSGNAVFLLHPVRSFMFIYMLRYY